RRPFDVVVFALLTFGLQLLAVPIYGRGSISVAAVGLLAAGFTLGPGVAVGVAVIVALVQWIRSRGRLHRALFDAANFTLAAAAAAFVYEGVRLATPSTVGRAGGALLGGLVYFAINTGLLSLAMGLNENRAVSSVWRERFRWVSGHFLAFGPLALASVVA